MLDAIVNWYWYGISAGSFGDALILTKDPDQAFKNGFPLAHRVLQDNPDEIRRIIMLLDQLPDAMREKSWPGLLNMPDDYYETCMAGDEMVGKMVEAKIMDVPDFNRFCYTNRKTVLWNSES